MGRGNYGQFLGNVSLRYWSKRPRYKAELSLLLLTVAFVHCKTWYLTHLLFGGMAFSRIGYMWSDIEDHHVLENIGDALFVEAVAQVPLYKSTQCWTAIGQIALGIPLVVAGRIEYVRGRSMSPLKAGERSRGISCASIVCK